MLRPPRCSKEEADVYRSPAAALTRCSLLAAGATAAPAALPRPVVTAEMLVAATFPGTWNDAHKTILVPYFKSFGNTADDGSRPNPAIRWRRAVIKVG